MSKRYYLRDDSGQLEIRNGGWHCERGYAYRIDTVHGIDWSYPHRRIGYHVLHGWPDATVVEYEGGVLIPAEEYDCPICELCGKPADDNVILRDRETGDPIRTEHRCR